MENVNLHEDNNVDIKDPELGMTTPRSWEEFRGTGLLWLVNSILHLFGWAIVCNVTEAGVVDKVYPARTKYRGFNEHDTREGYKRVSKYLEENIHTLVNEAKRE